MSEGLGDIEIPKEIQNRENDFVRWTAFDKKKQQVGFWVNYYCYAGITSRLGDYEIHCRPYWELENPTHEYAKKTPKIIKEILEGANRTVCTLPSTIYKRFWKLCKKNGLVPPEITTFVRKGQNRLVVPRKGWDYHTIYIILSLYRFCDSNPRTIANVTLLYEKLKSKKVDFIQCLHYGLVTSHYKKIGHTFFSVQATACQSNNAPLNLAAGMALASFCRMSLPERRKLIPKYCTIGMFCKVAKDWNPILSVVRSSNRYYNPKVDTGFGIPTYLLENTQCILSPEFAPLYTNPNSITEKEFAKYMETPN